MSRKKLSLILSPIFIVILIIIWPKIIKDIGHLTFLEPLKAAIITFVISPAIPVVETVSPASIQKGDITIINVIGQNFKSGLDPVEKVILVPTDDGDPIYSTNINNIESENSLTAVIDSSSIPIGSYLVKVINQFLGSDIVSTTSVPILISERQVELISITPTISSAGGILSGRPILPVTAMPTLESIEPVGETGQPIPPELRQKTIVAKPPLIAVSPGISDIEKLPVKKEAEKLPEPEIIPSPELKITASLWDKIWDKILILIIIILLIIIVVLIRRNHSTRKI